MVEDRAERPKFRGINLVSATENIRTSEEELIGRDHFVPEIEMSVYVDIAMPRRDLLWKMADWL